MSLADLAQALQPAPCNTFCALTTFSTNHGVSHYNCFANRVADLATLQLEHAFQAASVG